MDFVDCLIHLNDNFLREFSAEVYQPVLEAMFESNLVKPHRGAIFINSSKMDIDKFLSALFFFKKLNFFNRSDPLRLQSELVDQGSAPFAAFRPRRLLCKFNPLWRVESLWIQSLHLYR